MPIESTGIGGGYSHMSDKNVEKEMDASRHRRTFFRDPYDFIHSDRELMFWSLGLIALAIGLFGVLVWLDTPLRGRLLSPDGIFTLQLTTDPEAASSLLASWGPRGRAIAAYCVGLDYVLILSYTAALSATFTYFSRGWGGWLSKTAIALAWFSIIPGAFDIIENTGLFHLLTERRDPKWVYITSTCAFWKFFTLTVQLGALLLLPLIAALRRNK